MRKGRRQLRAFRYVQRSSVNVRADGLDDFLAKAAQFPSDVADMSEFPFIDAEARAISRQIGQLELDSKAPQQKIPILREQAISREDLLRAINELAWRVKSGHALLCSGTFVPLVRR